MAPLTPNRTEQVLRLRIPPVTEDRLSNLTSSRWARSNYCIGGTGMRSPIRTGENTGFVVLIVVMNSAGAVYEEIP